jgi:hypothetical protein
MTYCIRHLPFAELCGQPSEYSSISVQVYEGARVNHPTLQRPLFQSTAAVVTRKTLLERAADALEAQGYRLPLGPFPCPRAFTAFVHRQSAACCDSQLEACIHISVDGADVRVRVQYSGVAVAPWMTLPLQFRTLRKIARKAVEWVSDAKRCAR